MPKLNFTAIEHLFLGHPVEDGSIDGIHVFDSAKITQNCQKLANNLQEFDEQG